MNIDNTGVYRNTRKKIQEIKSNLLQAEKSILVDCIINERYNRFLSDHSDETTFIEGITGSKEPKGVDGSGKLIPYIGWYWRSIDFSNGIIPIGDCGDFIGFMANNKWGYPERDMTKEEVDNLMVIIETAKEISERGGDVGKNQKEMEAELAKIWVYMQTLKI